MTWFQKHRIKDENRRDFSHSPVFLGIPSILVALAWVAIWLVWPNRTPAVTLRSHNHSNEVLYTPFRISDQTPMLPCPPAELALDGEGARGLSLVDYWASHDRSLPQPAFTNTFPLLPLPPEPHHPLRTVSGQYSPGFDATLPTRKKRATDFSILMETTGELKLRGFAAPDIASANLLQSGKPWQAVLYVQIDTTGRPSSVFLESSTGDRNLDAALITTLYGGRLASTPSACRGRITVSAGRH